MARQTVGAVVERQGKDGHTYRALRFVAYGKRRHVSLGTVGAAEAERELSHVIADAQRGRWIKSTSPAGGYVWASQRPTLGGVA